MEARMAKKLSPHEAAAMILKQRMEQARPRSSAQVGSGQKSRSRSEAVTARKS
jgi:hypothetical protein